MTKAERRIEELTDAIRKLTEEVRRLSAPRLVPYPVYPQPYYVPYYPPYYVPYSQPMWGGTITTNPAPYDGQATITYSVGTQGGSFSGNAQIGNVPYTLTGGISQ